MCADHTCELPPWQTEEELKSEVIWSTGLALYIQFDFSPACRAHTLCEGQSSIPAHYPINCFMAGLQWSSSTDCSAPVQLEVTQTQQVYSYMLLFWNVLASFSFFLVNLLNIFFFFCQAHSYFHLICSRVHDRYFFLPHKQLFPSLKTSFLNTSKAQALPHRGRFSLWINSRLCKSFCMEH